VSVLLTALHLSQVAPICSYVTLTLAVVGVGSGGDSDNRDKTDLFRCQNRWRIDISNPSCSRGVTCRVTVTIAKSLKESLGCVELARIEERRCVLCTVDQCPRHCRVSNTSELLSPLLTLPVSSFDYSCLRDIKLTVYV